MGDVLDNVEDAFKEQAAEIRRLRNRTNLDAVQGKLNAFMDEIRLLHTGLLNTLKGMIDGLNAEGVKRYEGAVKAVSENINPQLKAVENSVQELLKYLENNR